MLLFIDSENLLGGSRFIARGDPGIGQPHEAVSCFDAKAKCHAGNLGIDDHIFLKLEKVAVDKV